MLHFFTLPPCSSRAASAPGKLLLIGLLLATAPGTGVRAQTMGNYRQQQQVPPTSNFVATFRDLPGAAQVKENGTIDLTVSALSNQTADSYVAIFSIYQVGTTAEETNLRMNERVAALRQGLEGLGIGRGDVYIDMVNFLPTYAFSSEKKIFSKKTLTEVPTGFQLQKNLHVRYRESELLDRIVTVAAAQEVYDIIKVDYQVDRPQAVYAELRRSVFGYLDSLEALYARNGIALDSSQKVTAERAWVTYPGERYQTYSAYASQSLTQGERADAVVDRADKPELSFYNAIPANDFDLVLNPELLEPAAQFTYTLKVRYTLPPKASPPQPGVVNRYYVLTAEGRLQQLVLPENPPE